MRGKALFRRHVAVGFVNVYERSVLARYCLWSGPLNDWSRLANKNINILNEILKGVWGEQ